MLVLELARGMSRNTGGVSLVSCVDRIRITSLQRSLLFEITSRMGRVELKNTIRAGWIV
jgi:hypothetical protein